MLVCKGLLAISGDIILMLKYYVRRFFLNSLGGLTYNADIKQSCSKI